MKRLLSLFLCLLMIIGCFAGCKKKAVPTVASGEQITRGAWVKLLADSFYLNSTTEKPYFSNIAKDNELFNAVQACVDLGIIENEDTFNKDNAVTYKEIALNTINAIGISTVQDYLKTDKKLSEKQLIDFATDKDIVKSVSENFATTTDAQNAVKTAVDLYINKPFVEKEKIELNDDVIDLKDKKITVANDSFTYDKADKLKVGDIIILPPTEEYVSGVARKVESVSGNTVKTTTPKLEEVYETIHLSSVTVPKVSDIKAANNGVTFENYSEIELTSAKSKPQVTTLALNSKNNSDVLLLDNKGASFNVNINITKGKLSIDEGWNSLNGSFSEQDIKNNYFQYKVDKNGNLYTSKYNSGYEIKGKISISDLSLTNDIDFGLIQGLKKAETKVNFKASVNLSVKGKINETIDVFTTSIPIGTTGIWVDAVFSLVFDSNGDVSVKCTLENTTTYTYEKGLKTANDTKLNNKAAISGKLSAKVGPRAVLVALGIDLFDIQAMIGLASKAEVSAEQGTSEIPCVDVKVYAPTLSIAFAGDKNTLLNQLGFSATWKVYDIDGGWQKPLTTLTYHYEAKNGWVDKCTHPEKTASEITTTSSQQQSASQQQNTTPQQPSSSSQPSPSSQQSSSSQQQIIKNDMFNNTYWLLGFGQTLGSMYTAKFYKNGTFDAVTQGGISHGTYKVVNDKLFISVDYVKNAEFIKVEDGFRSTMKYQMQVGSGYYEMSPITEDDYLKSYQNYVNQNSTSSKEEQQQENSSNITSSTEEKTHYNEPKLGKYSAQMWWNSDNKSYVYITLKEKGVFTIESNFDLKNWKDCEPFTKNGTYVLEDADGNITWLILYIDDKEYRTYAVGNDGTFFQDQEIVFNYTNSEETNEQQTTNITLTEAKQIAENLISKYHQFSFLGVCCDVEYIDKDMSKFLTQTQKDIYWGTQYKLNCCHSIGESKKHIKQYIDESLLGNFYSDNFFFDDKTNLYVILGAFGILGYEEISIVEYSSSKIVARATIEDIDGYTGAYDTFILQKKGNGFLITDIKQ